MKFGQYLTALNRFADENPDALDLTVIYASDDEGNCVSRCNYTPTIRGWDQCDSFDDEGTQAVCIN